MPRFLANSFLCLNYVFSLQFNWFKQKKNTICLLKTEFKAKKLFLEIEACNLKVDFIYGEQPTLLFIGKARVVIQSSSFFFWLKLIGSIDDS